MVQTCLYIFQYSTLIWQHPAIKYCWIIAVCITPVQWVVWCIKSLPKSQLPSWHGINMYLHVYAVYRRSTYSHHLFTTTLHVPSGLITLATLASLSSALQPLLLSSLLPVTSHFLQEVLVQPVPKAYRKCCVKFQTTPSVRTGFPLAAVIQHSLAEHLKCLKSKTWNDLTLANLFFLERRMRSKRVKQSLGYGYLSKREWFSLCPQYV